MIACASKCGRISFYSTDTLELIHVTSPVGISGITEQSSTFIQSLTFLSGGHRVIARHDDHYFTLVEISEEAKSCKIKLKRLPGASGNNIEVISIHHDDSMFAIRQNHLLSFYLITESVSTIEIVQTLTISLFTQMSPFIQSNPIDLRTEDMTSKARVTRYTEMNKPISISPTLTMISRNSEGLLSVTILGSIGTQVTSETDQYILACTLNISSAMQHSLTELHLHTCYSVGKVHATATGDGYVAMIDGTQDVLHVINTSILHRELTFLLDQLHQTAKSTLPSRQEDVEIWENVKSLRESLYVAQEIYFHDELLKSCVGTFEMKKNSPEMVRYALAVSPRYEVRGFTEEEEKERISIFISRKERGNKSQSIYEVMM